MEKRELTAQMIRDFAAHLARRERAPATVAKYLHGVRSFAAWLGEDGLSPEKVSAWKAGLRERLSPGTVNGRIAAVNALFQFLRWDDCRTGALKVQRRAFRADERELGRGEYQRLVETAKRRGKERLALLLEAIGGTGIRVSETAFISVEAARKGMAEIVLKGKIRTILLPGKLCRKLLNYARRQKIASGPIFRTRRGNPLSRGQIWAGMKALARPAGVDPRKVFPHNLRHLFARAFYSLTRDVVRLADILGHSSLTTTRIYLISTGSEHKKELEKLQLII